MSESPACNGHDGWTVRAQKATIEARVVVLAVGVDAFARRPSEAVDMLNDGLGGPSYGHCEIAMADPEQDILDERHAAKGHPN
jgi:hypothetical protein